MSTAASGKSSDSTLNGKLTIEQGNNRMLVNDGTNDRLLLGEELDGDIVVKLSQSGYDVKTATNSQLIMSSEFNSFKIASKQTVTVVKGVNVAKAVTNYSHGLGVIPCVVGFVSTNSATFAGTWPVPYHAVSYGASITLDGVFDINMTSSVIQCGITVPTSGTPYTQSITATFVLYILAETA